MCRSVEAMVLQSQPRSRSAHTFSVYHFDKHGVVKRLRFGAVVIRTRTGLRTNKPMRS